MPNIRVGYGSDFVVKDQKVGIGSEDPRALLDVRGTLKGDFNITGVSTLRVYGGFAAQKQNVTKDSSIGFSTTGIGTVGITSFISVNERESGFTSLVGEYNTVSEDLIVDEGKIFEVSTTNITGITTLGTQEVYAPDDSVVSVGTLESVSIQSHFNVPDGGINDRPDQPTEGMVRFNDDLNTLEFYNGIEWRQFTVSGASGRGVFGGGRTPGDSAIIDYIQIMSTGNAINFGDLRVARTDAASFSNELRGIWAGGKDPAVSTHIDYITLASRGNGVDFGDVTPAAMGASGAGASSSTRGVFALGQAPGASNVLHYVQIMTTGNSVDFGDLTGNLSEGAACGSPTRGLFNKGTGSAGIDVITIASLGNAVEFGDDIMRPDQQRGCGSCSNSIRGLFASGGTATVQTDNNVIRYVTIATNGNAIDFGDRTIITRLVTAAATSTRATFAGGINSGGTNFNNIDYVTISTTGNAIDFGDMTSAFHAHSGCSDSHGGLGGF